MAELPNLYTCPTCGRTVDLYAVETQVQMRILRDNYGDEITRYAETYWCSIECQRGRRPSWWAALLRFLRR